MIAYTTFEFNPMQKKKLFRILVVNPGVGLCDTKTACPEAGTGEHDSARGAGQSVSPYCSASEGTAAAAAGEPHKSTAGATVAV